MTLQSSGTIKLSQIAAEFGTATDMTPLRGKGGTPSTGPLSFSNFYGKSNITFSPTGDQLAIGTGNTYITLNCSQSATWTWSGFPANSINYGTNISNGGSGTAVQFRVGAGKSIDLDVLFTVTGSSGGSSNNWNCEIQSNHT